MSETSEIAPSAPMPDHQITYPEILINIGMTVVILVVGILLLNGGYNESFYVENSTVRAIFTVITNLGMELVFIAIFVVLYFAFEKHFSRRLIIGFLIIVFVTLILKEIFQDPRPSTNILDGEMVEVGYGFPSGHTTFSLMFWGYMFLAFKGHSAQKPVQIWCIFAFTMVPLSRLIIGVHDLQDVIGGYAIAISFLTLYAALEPKWLEWKDLALEKKIGLSVAAIFIIFLISWGILYAIHPHEALEGAIELSLPVGILLGFSIAFPLEEKNVQFDPLSLPRNKKIIAAVIGLIFTFALYFGLSAAFSGLEPLIFWRGLRYFLLAFLIGLVGPLIVKKIK